MALLVAATAARATVACEAVPGNLLLNCGFEDGPANWAFTASGSVNSYGYLGPAHSGVSEAYVNAYPGYGTIAQTIATIPGHTYVINFWLASNGGNGDIGLSFGSMGLGSQYNPIPGDGNYYEISDYAGGITLTSIATDYASTLVIGGGGLTGTYFIDDVSVQDISIPEPATAGILAAGCTAFAASSRRRRR